MLPSQLAALPAQHSLSPLEPIPSPCQPSRSLLSIFKAAAAPESVVFCAVTGCHLPGHAPSLCSHPREFTQHLDISLPGSLQGRGELCSAASGSYNCLGWEGS